MVFKVPFSKENCETGSAEDKVLGDPGTAYEATIIKVCADIGVDG